MKLWFLINPSGACTFRAASVEIAGCVANLLSPCFGARCMDPGFDESTPIMFGWKEWLDDRGIDSKFIDAHLLEIADAFDSFLIGDVKYRLDVESMLAALSEEAREKWRAERQDRYRSSVNKIGEAAYKYADKLRKKAASLAGA